MCEEATNNFKLIGIWMSEKKFQKLRWSECVSVCRNHGYDLVKLDLDKPLEEQGPLRVFIHKLTDIIAAADQGDIKSREVIGNVEQYISNHPDMTVVDSLDNVRVLLDRYRYYSLIENQPQLRKHGVFTPPFCILTSAVHKEKVCLLEARGVTFPLVCKPLVAHGSKSAHSMCVVFNSAGLAHCRPPCVLQSFINHNAVLYKIFLVGNRYYVTERPSLKNFYACNEREPIYFHSGDVCKADSQSTLSILDPHDATGIEHKPQLDLIKVEAIIKVLRKELQLILFGVDIVIDNTTNHYAIIDINVYPGYEGFPNFFDHLIDSVDDMVNSREESIGGIIVNGIPSRTEENIENNYGYNQECSLTGFSRNNLINVGNTNLDSYCKNILKDVTDIFEG